MSLIFALLHTMIINYFFHILSNIITARNHEETRCMAAPPLFLLKVKFSILPLLLHHLKTHLCKCLLYFLRCLQSECILHRFRCP